MMDVAIVCPDIIENSEILRDIGKGPVHGYMLAKRLGISLSSVYEHLRDLREDGLVAATGRGRRRIYTLAEKGRHLLKALP
jgi:DNA-binding PadR family transcriptional regulator